MPSKHGPSEERDCARNCGFSDTADSLSVESPKGLHTALTDTTCLFLTELVTHEKKGKNSRKPEKTLPEINSQY